MRRWTRARSANSLTGPGEHLFEQGLGFGVFLLLEMLQGLFVVFELLLDGRVDQARGALRPCRLAEANSFFFRSLSLPSVELPSVPALRLSVLSGWLTGAESSKANPAVNRARFERRLQTGSRAGFAASDSPSVHRSEVFPSDTLRLPCNWTAFGPVL